MSDGVTFVCADCDTDVYVFGYCPPGTTRCAPCAWLALVADPVERERLRKWMAEHDWEAAAVEAVSDAKPAADQVGAGRQGD